MRQIELGRRGNAIWDGEGRPRGGEGRRREAVPDLWVGAAVMEDFSIFSKICSGYRDWLGVVVLRNKIVHEERM